MKVKLQIGKVGLRRDAGGTTLHWLRPQIGP